jgi:hypothetical protein
METELFFHSMGTVSNTARRWLCYALNPMNVDVFNKRKVVDTGFVFPLPKVDTDAGSVVEVVMVDAEGVLTELSLPIPVSENDLSIALRVVYRGQFAYATAGDLGGENSPSQWGYTYNDIETHTAGWKDIDIYRANHHGSEHSSNQYILKQMQPSACVISCGKNAHGHPDQAVLDRFKDQACVVYMTNICDPDRDYTDVTIAHGDVNIFVNNSGATYTINNGRMFVSKKRPLCSSIDLLR